MYKLVKCRWFREYVFYWENLENRPLIFFPYHTYAEKFRTRIYISTFSINITDDYQSFQLPVAKQYSVRFLIKRSMDESFLEIYNTTLGPVYRVNLCISLWRFYCTRKKSISVKSSPRSRPIMPIIHVRIYSQFFL